jgi:hypothetical protein
MAAMDHSNQDPVVHTCSYKLGAIRGKRASRFSLKWRVMDVST